MKKHLISSTMFALFSGLLAFGFAGCNGDDSGSGAATGPSSGSSFSGTSISFNPDIVFTDATNCTYTNTEAASAFPQPYTNEPATYTYVPNADYTTGTLTLIFGDTSIPSLVLDLSNFVHSGTAITGFTARSGGTSYPVTVTSGTLTAYTPPPSGGGSSASESPATDIPASVQGTYTLTFHKSGSTTVSAGPGLPEDGATTTFVVGAQTLAFDGKTLTNPVFSNGNTNEWIFKDGSTSYALSKTNIDTLNEINVGSSGVYYGQYNAHAGSGGSGGDTDTSATAGTYGSSIAKQPSGTSDPAGIPTDGASVAFTISSDLQTLTFNGRSVPLKTDGRPTQLLYTDSDTAPTNNLTVTLQLDAVTHVVIAYSATYTQTTVGVPPVIATAYFTSNTVFKQ